MAPIKPRKKQKQGSNSNKVQSGRIIRSEPIRRYANKNKGKELMPAVIRDTNAKKELFPHTSSSNDTKELPLQLFPSAVRASLNIEARNSKDRTLVPIVIQPQRDRSKAKAKSRTKSRSMIAVQLANLQQRRAKQVADALTKRLQAMEYDPDHFVEDARFTSTIPYRSARLDLQQQVNAHTNQSRKLEFSIAVGFWGYAPSFTPVKIFSLSVDRFADPKSLATLILANNDVKRAIASVGVDISKDITFVGYEMQFPKGLRYKDNTERELLGGASQNSFQVVQSGDRVLVNTECAMREFFWQAENYAVDENGRVLIHAIGRIGKKLSNGYETFDVNWRNDEEKELAAQEKKKFSEGQSFANSTEKNTLNGRMKAIEERSRMAVENAQAVKQEMEEAVKQEAQNNEPVTSEINFNGIGLNLDLDLDLDIDLD